MFAATDISNFLACQHISVLDRAEGRKEVKRPFFKDPTVELLRKLGLEHEQRYLHQLRARSVLAIAEIDVSRSWQAAATETVEALKRGADVVYQATFLDGQWGGRSDFLVRVDKASALGPWSYEVVETKLARSAKAGALIQLCFYSELLSRIQGGEPQWMHVALGGGQPPERFPVQRYIAYFRRIRAEFEKAWQANVSTYPEPTEHCEICSWYPVCDRRWRDDDYSSLVAGISRNQRKALCERGVNTVASLGRLGLPVNPRIERIGATALLRIRDQARLQVQGREEGRLMYELLGCVEPGKGLAALPEPCPGDIFLDFEANPFVLDQGLEYLTGILDVSTDGDSEYAYQGVWAFDRAEEKKAFESFISRMMECWHQ